MKGGPYLFLLAHLLFVLMLFFFTHLLGPRRYRLGHSKLLFCLSHLLCSAWYFCAPLCNVLGSGDILVFIFLEKNYLDATSLEPLTSSAI